MGKATPKSQALNSVILKAIKAGCNTAKLLSTTPRSKAAIDLEASQTGRDKMRILDGALQALRRQGLIEFKRGTWHHKDGLL